MRNETLLKVIIAVFAIILIVLATFVYGNIQRSNQNKQKSTNNSNQTSVKTLDTTGQDKPNQSSQPGQSGKSPTTTPTPAPSPASKPAPVVTSPPAKANMPTTGAGDAVIPMTILSVLAYIVLKKRDLIVSKSQLR